MKTIKITDDESRQVEELFYNYNALLDLLKQFEVTNDIYSDTLYMLKQAKYQLEHKKQEIINKYAPDFNGTCSFDFINCALDLT